VSAKDRRSLARPAGPLPTLPDLSQALPGIGARGYLEAWVLVVFVDYLREQRSLGLSKCFIDGTLSFFRLQPRCLSNREIVDSLTLAPTTRYRNSRLSERAAAGRCLRSASSSRLPRSLIFS
jgi:hypothetical protein